MPINRMYIKGNGKTYQLPVLPETIKITNSANNASLSVVGIGEVTILQGRKAKQYSFSSIFPNTYFTGCAFNGKSKYWHRPKTFVKFFESLINSKKLVIFVFSRNDSSKHLSISKKCTIERFEYSETGGDIGTISYTLTLKEYRKPNIRQIKKKKGKAKASSSKKRTSTKSMPKTYKIKKGDTLKTIAKKIYGLSSYDGFLYNNNKSVIEKAAKKHKKKSSKKGKYLYAGTVLKIATPRLQLRS